MKELISFISIVLVLNIIVLGTSRSSSSKQNRPSLNSVSLEPKNDLDELFARAAAVENKRQESEFPEEIDDELDELMKLIFTIYKKRYNLSSKGISPIKKIAADTTDPPKPEKNDEMTNESEMPAERTLPEKLAEEKGIGTATPEELDSLMERIIPFYRKPSDLSSSPIKKIPPGDISASNTDKIDATFNEDALDIGEIIQNSIPKELSDEVGVEAVDAMAIPKGVTDVTTTEAMGPPFFPNPPSESAQPRNCKRKFIVPKRVTLKHVDGFGNKKGFATDYSTLAFLFASEYELGHFMPMIDIRGHRFDNGSYATNVGLATRYIPHPNNFCELLGLNVFYDWRQGLHRNFNQVGVGIEILGKRWDFRANGYVPFGQVSFRKKCVFDDGDGFRSVHKFCEFTNYGFNLEIGYLAVNSKNFLLYTAAGPYYLARKSCHHHTRGWEARIRPQYKDYFAVDLSISHDPVFETVYQAAFILYFPFYQICRKNKGPCGITDRQIYQPIERFEAMPLGRRSCWKFNW